MKVCFLTLGSLGDVQPYIVLAKKLVSIGHCAIICTSKSFKVLIEESGIEFHEASLDLMSLTQTEEGKAVLESPLKHFRLALKMSKDIIKPGFRKTFDDFLYASKSSDIIVYHPKAFVAVDIAEKLEIPCVSMPPIPITYPISEFPCIAISSSKNFGSYLNKLSYRFSSKAESSYIKEINDFRIKSLQLKRRKSGDYFLYQRGNLIPTIYPISKKLFSDVKSWNEIEVTGFLFDSVKKDLSNELSDFLNNNPKPIAISFSSMPLKNPNKFIEMLNLSLKESENKAILLAGNSGIDFKGNENLYVIKQVPHGILFPRCKAVIHHGGVGTTAAAISAGIPQLIIPFSADQPFWANRMYKLGVALKPIKEKELTIDKFKEIFSQFEDKDLNNSAKELSDIINSENGLDNAIIFLEETAKR